MMLREDGIKEFPIWILGDSNPKRWEHILKKPFDSRHPIRHNILGSVFEIVQEQVFEKLQNRVDTSKIYIRNAIEKSDSKPADKDVAWSIIVENEISEFSILCNCYHPIIILCFGAFAFEFARRVKGENPIKRFRDWNTINLGNEFRNRLKDFKTTEVNIIPLLHRSIAGGKFIQSHLDFCNGNGENYFEYVGMELAKTLLDNKDIIKVWKV